MSRYLAGFVLVLAACTPDKFPATTECTRLSESNVARDCRGFETPSGVSFAIDSGAFTVEGTPGEISRVRDVFQK